MSDDNSPREEPTLSSPITRRTAIGVLGASAVGLGAAGNVSAAAVSSNRFEITDDGPNPMPIVDSEGADLPEEPGEEMELFDAEPEFPPFVSFEMMDEEFGEAAERYLQPHGAESLLSSRRLAVHPEGEPLTWGDFDGASAHTRRAGGRSRPPLLARRDRVRGARSRRGLHDMGRPPAGVPPPARGQPRRGELLHRGRRGERRARGRRYAR